MGEDTDLIRISDLAEFAAALAQFRKYGYVAAEHVLEIDFRHAAGIIADYDGGAGDVLKAAVFDPKLIGIVGIDGDGSWDVAEFVVHQGKAGFVFADSRFR